MSGPLGTLHYIIGCLRTGLVPRLHSPAFYCTMYGVESGPLDTLPYIICGSTVAYQGSEVTSRPHPLGTHLG